MFAVAYDSRWSRRLAFVVAALALISLLIRLVLSAAELGGVGPALIFLTQFFTILTNTAIMVTLGLIALGQMVSTRLMRAFVVSIICVGLVYHALLAHLVDFQGWAKVADHGLHTVVPAGAFLWWVLTVRHPQFRFFDIALWTVWPLSYVFYVLGRAEFSAFYPYPFMDLATLGWSRLIGNLVGLAVAFIMVGFALVALERMIKRRRAT